MAHAEGEKNFRKFAGHLSMLRGRLGRTQEQTAELIGISHRSLKGWESGNTRPTVANLKKLIEVYLSNGAFTKNRERAEAIELWEISPLKTEFDQAWFAQLEDKYLHHTADSERSIVQPAEEEEQEPLPREVYVPYAEELSQSVPQTHPFSEHANDRNRHYLLEQVHTIWIEGVLEQSLQSVVHISLGLHEHPDATENPWKLHVQETLQSSRPLPPGIHITQIYDQMHGKLLILGDPGSGKTARLLELTRDLLKRARNDESHAIPVVFNLSSWATRQQLLADWLIEELHEKYLLPLEPARNWVNNDQLTLLLDGLDEVDEFSREACLKMINLYRREHSSVPIVVCSRKDEYFTLTSRLVLNSAIMLQPLTPQMVDEYFTRAGKQLTSLRAALRSNPDLCKLAENPLMLNILALTYQNASVDDFKFSQPGWQHQIFETYIQRMFTRRQMTRQYTQPLAIRWLARLAHQMRQQNQSIFHIEYMQAEWLSNSRLRHLYEGLGIRLTSVLIGILTNIVVNNLFGSSDIADTFLYGFIGGLIGFLLSGESVDPSLTGALPLRQFWQRFWAKGLPSGLLTALCVGLSFRLYIGALPGYSPSNWLHDWLVFGTGFGICGVLLGIYLSGTSSTSPSGPAGTDKTESLWQSIIRGNLLKKSLFAGIILGMCSGICDTLSSPLLRAHNEPTIDTISDLLSFAITTLLVNLIIAETKKNIRPTESVVWLWRAFSSSRHLRNGLFIGVAVALGLGTVYWLDFGASIGLAAGFSYGIGSTLSYLTLIGCLSSISETVLDRRHRIRPNEGMRRSVRNGIIYGFISGCVSWITSFINIMLVSRFIPANDISLSPGLQPGLALALIYGTLVGVSTALTVFLLRGGIAYIRHLLLRLLLWRTKAMPWNYARFLDYAAERVFLRKVGGGYIFIHRLLLEHFADLYTIRSAEEARG